MNPIFQLLHVLVFFLGADRVVITGIQPNPGGTAQTLAAEGWYWAASANKAVEVRLVAEFPITGQLASRVAERARSEWHGKLMLPAGTYECWIELVTKDAAGELILTRTPTVRVAVK